MGKKINCALLGFGVVGKSVFDILSQQKKLLKKRTGSEINISKILVRSPKKYASMVVSPAEFVTDPELIFNDPSIDVVIEVMGGENPAKSYITTALSKGKKVVTANKEVVSKHKKDFFQLAQDNRTDIYYEAAVAGGIPLIRAIKTGLSANKIVALYGILNGTTNYILTKIAEEGLDYSVALKNAQDLGFAEANPSMDVSGLDTAYKLTILASDAFGVDIHVSDLHYEGIEHITLKDIRYAKDMGYAVKLLGIGKESDDGTLEFKVHPTLIPLTHPLSFVQNEVNACYVVGDMVGETMFLGKGAGGNPTASAIVSDVVDISFGQTEGSKRNLRNDFTVRPLKAISNTLSQMFIRLSVSDTPGVLEIVSGIFKRHQLSISKILQKNGSGNKVDIIIVTHLAEERLVELALDELKRDTDRLSVEAFIRVGLDENTLAF